MLSSASCERAIRAMSFRSPDRVPITYGCSGRALLHMHSDGVTLEIIPDLIEIGLNSFNPQLSCQDPREVKRLAGNQLCILTDIDRQRLLPFGTPAEIQAHIAELHGIFGRREGGLIWGAEIGSEVPLENAEALLQAFNSYR